MRKWLPPTTSDPCTRLWVWQQRVSLEQEKVTHESWGFLKRAYQLATGRERNNKLNLGASKTEVPPRVGYDCSCTRDFFYRLLNTASRLRISETGPERICNANNKVSGIFLCPRVWIFFPDVKSLSFLYLVFFRKHSLDLHSAKKTFVLYIQVQYLQVLNNNAMLISI